MIVGFDYFNYHSIIQAASSKNLSPFYALDYYLFGLKENKVARHYRYFLLYMRLEATGHHNFFYFLLGLGNFDRKLRSAMYMPACKPADPGWWMGLEFNEHQSRKAGRLYMRIHISLSLSLSFFLFFFSYYLLKLSAWA